MLCFNLTINNSFLIILMQPCYSNYNNRIAGNRIATREKKRILGGIPDLFGIFFKYFQTIISPILFRFGLRTSKSYTTTA